LTGVYYLTEIITIQQFKELDADHIYRACIVVKVTKIAEPIQGTTKGRNWTRMPITISDKTGSFDISIFNGNIPEIEFGKTYEFGELGVDTFMGNNVPKILPKTTIREIVVSSKDYLQDRQNQINKETTVQTEKIESTKKINFDHNQLAKIDKALDNLQVLEKIVTQKLQTGDIQPNPARVGMYMKLIYDKMV
jgi:hypothetical protein